MKLEPCMIFKEKDGTEFLYIEAVTEKEVCINVIDRTCDNYQSQEWVENDGGLIEMLKNDFELLN